MGKQETSIWPAKQALVRELLLMGDEDEQRRIRDEHAEGVWAEFQEEVEGLAHAAGFGSREEYIQYLITHGDHGVEIVRRLRQALAASPQEAHENLYDEAGAEAGLAIDPLKRITNRKRVNSGRQARAEHQMFDKLPPSPKRKGKTRAAVSFRADDWLDMLAHDEVVREALAGEQAASTTADLPGE